MFFCRILCFPPQVTPGYSSYAIFEALGFLMMPRHPAGEDPGYGAPFYLTRTSTNPRHPTGEDPGYEAPFYLTQMSTNP